MISNTNSVDILIIEDSTMIAQLISDYFKQKGFRVKNLTTGEALKEQLIYNDPPKLILLDINLPDSSGYDLCKAIKSDTFLCKIPVFYITGMPENEIKERLIDTSADGYISKPFNFSDFHKLLSLLE